MLVATIQGASRLQHQSDLRARGSNESDQRQRAATPSFIHPRAAPPGGHEGLTWFGSSALDSQLAQGALTLAEVSSRDSRRLLDTADAVLDRTATDPASTPRNAVFHSARLSRAHVAADDLDRAVPAAQTALRRLPTVRSRRCTLVLHRLEADLDALPPARHPAPLRSLQDQLRATRVA